MSAKIIPFRCGVLLVALLLAAAGCTPAGPRALLKGKKYLDQGDNAAAVAQFKTAAELLVTNAAAWNYLGVARQRAGQPEAVNAYKRALEVDRDLLEARLNLGMLYLEQNQAELAKTEFTAYTLRRPNDAAGWLKLGAAQLKLGEIIPAERSFSSVLTLKTSEAEAYNGLGLARIQRGNARDAAQFFAAAVKSRSDYAPAVLNLAAVDQQYLHDNKAALENYRAYLVLTPRPANWDEVKAIADSLEQTLATVVPPPTPAVKPISVTAAAVVEPKPQPKPVPSPTPHPTPTPTPPKPVVAEAPPPQPISTPPPMVVQVAPDPQIVSLPASTMLPKPTTPPAVEPKPVPPPSPTYFASGITPLPGTVIETPPKPAFVEPKPAPVVIIPPAPVNFPRYNYLSPARPAVGDRRVANVAFTQARRAEQDEKWGVALQGYQKASSLDPSWFEAQYNAGVIAAFRLRSYPIALASYETALAIQPGSVDARYNFALALKAAGYAADATDELKKILADHPAETRAHLALANLCAQALHDPAQARLHYQKVLELGPADPQTAADIRFWLAANPG